jgi:capsular polysaccharide biosynthesis protein
MSEKSNTTILLRGWFSITLFGFLGLILALIVSFIQPLKYSSTVRILILQNVGLSVDAYTASRSEERIAENLSTIIYTTTFFNQVLNSGFNIDETTFPIDDAKRRRLWGRTVQATVARGSGLLTVAAYHPDVRQAEQIVRAVSYVLTEHVADYTSGNNIEVRLIDAPLNSRWPVKPNIVANAISGFVLGGLFGMVFLLLRAERVRRRHQLIHEDF